MMVKKQSLSINNKQSQWCNHHCQTISQ